MKHMVSLHDGTKVPAIGQGTWCLGESRERFEEEKDTLRAGIKAGMTLIDTAEMYGSGKSELLVGEAIKGFDRSRLFLVSKVHPQNAGKLNIFKSCEGSLRRMETDYIDLYLLHWRGNIPLAETAECMEKLVGEKKIRAWGVSNFDTHDMEELWDIPEGRRCATNQVLYHAASRGIEFDLLPWQRRRKIPLMAYCPLAQGGDLKRGLYENSVLKNIAQVHGATVTQVLLAFVIRGGDVIAIPRTGNVRHALDNAEADGLVLSEEEIALIQAEFPAPQKKVPLDIK